MLLKLVESAAPVKFSPLLANDSALPNEIVLALPAILSVSIPAAATVESLPPDKAQVSSFTPVGAVAEFGSILSVTESALANLRLAAVRILKSLALIVLMPPVAAVLRLATPPVALTKETCER